MKKRKQLVLFTLFIMNLVDQPAPEVTIEQGILSGKISSDGTIFLYMGVPYASTTSDTRFQVRSNSFISACRYWLTISSIFFCEIVGHGKMTHIQGVLCRQHY